MQRLSAARPFGVAALSVLPRATLAWDVAYGGSCSVYVELKAVSANELAIAVARQVVLFVGFGGAVASSRCHVLA